MLILNQLMSLVVVPYLNNMCYESTVGKILVKICGNYVITFSSVPLINRNPEIGGFLMIYSSS